MDTGLVVRAQGGDEVAFATLVDVTSARLRAVAMSILGDYDLAEEATQRSLVSIWRSLPGLRDTGRFEAWSYRLLVNSCYTQIRAAQSGGTAT
jgi:RNA polymerase sigma-70 factor (ECF subfamily)